jgi:hypothetical protein
MQSLSRVDNNRDRIATLPWSVVSPTADWTCSSSYDRAAYRRRLGSRPDSEALRTA